MPAGMMFVVGMRSPFVHFRICGRFFSFTDAADAIGGVVNTESICSKFVSFPFLNSSAQDVFLSQRNIIENHIGLKFRCLHI